MSTPEAQPRPKRITFWNEIMIYEDANLTPSTVQFYDSQGKLLATVYSVDTIHVGPKR